MKIRICPICGSKDLVYQGEGKVLCWECSNYVVPLVTPQEEKK